MMITLKQWAENKGINPVTARKWANTGRLPEAQKMGRDWLVPEDTQRPIDRRYVDNPIRNRRKERANL